MRQLFSRSRRTSIVLVAGLALLLILVFYAYRSASKRPELQPYPTGRTRFTYAETYRQDGQEFAIFRFGNGQGFQLNVSAKVLKWDEEKMRWNEEALTISEIVPNRSQWEVRIARHGKWKVMVKAYAQPTLPEKLADRFAGGRSPGGLIGAWSSPEMNDAKPGD